MGLTGLNQNQIEVFCLFFFEFVAKISNIYITLGGDLKISEQNNKIIGGGGGVGGRGGGGPEQKIKLGGGELNLGGGLGT